MIGGSCEIAITLARRMIETSIHPILTYRNEAGRDRIHKSMPSFSGKYESRRLVLGDIESLDALFEDIKGNLDFLVDFANGDYESLIASADDETVSRYFEENISFRAHILKRAGRTMLIKKRGRLVYVSSTAAASPNPGQGFYSAAKSASEALYRNMGLELGKRGITAVVVRPGYVDAGRGAVYLAKKRIEEIAAKTNKGPQLKIADLIDYISYQLEGGGK